jgi:hypothetical protein
MNELHGIRIFLPDLAVIQNGERQHGEPLPGSDCPSRNRRFWKSYNSFLTSLLRLKTAEPLFYLKFAA